jgi:hypothetical protein
LVEDAISIEKDRPKMEGEYNMKKQKCMYVVALEGIYVC